ncbi:MAG: Crp/Fnr family transcriptional regulator [Bacteroidetes bacterium]|jgi:CRP/FNR family transcriptional regulator|nr:Crp/Fnr family transcriptional regulator [Bacteroidota bacterium]
MSAETCNLSSCFLCANCIPAWRELIAVKKETTHFKKGELIFKEGDKVNGIFFLYSGAVKVHKQWVDQKELIIRFTRQGDILGHRGLAAGDLYPVSATALIASEACFISNAFLETILQADHTFTYRLMQLYSSELQKAEMRMRNLALMEVKGRIAETLLKLLDVFGIDAEGYMTVPVTRQDIAAYAGTTYETVFKFLKTLTTDKIISADGKSIKINAENKLRKIVKNAK